MTKKLSLLLFFAAFFCGISAYAAPGGSLTVVNHPNTYPTPQNVTAALTDDGKRITLQWDGVHWPVDGYPETVDGKEVPTNFYYEVYCRTRQSGTTEWGDWWNSDNPSRYEWKSGAFLEHVTITRDAKAGMNYQFRVRCVQYVSPENPNDLPESERIQDVYMSDYSDIVQAYRTLDSLKIAGTSTSHPLWGNTSISVKYTYTSSREKEGDEPLYFTFKAIEIPDDGWYPEAPAAGQKPYARRDGTPLTVKSLTLTAPNTTKSKKITPDNFALTSSADTGTITWNVYEDIKNYYHDDVTLWIQGWEKSETEGGEPRQVVDEAIGKITIDTRLCTAKTGTDANGKPAVVLTWPKEPTAATYKITRGSNKMSITLADNVADTIFVDSMVEPTVRYTYMVIAKDSTGKEFVASSPFYGYSQLDSLSLNNIQPQSPWNGKIDIFAKYKTARDEWTRDGKPYFKLTAKAGDKVLDVKTLSMTVITPYTTVTSPINPDNIQLEEEDDSKEYRLVWDAGADLGGQFFDALTLTIECAGVEPDAKDVPGLEWAGGTASYTIANFDTRSPRVVNLAAGTLVYADLAWFKDATKADVFCNGTKVFELPEEAGNTRGRITLGKNELNIWGENELKLVPDKGEPWTSVIKYPDFDFSVSQGVTGGITLMWSLIDQYAVAGYRIQRRIMGSMDAFEAVQTVGPDVMTWTDKTAEEATIYEYTVVPLNSDGEPIGPIPSPQRGYRTLEKIEFVQARQFYPWSTRVALDIYYKSARQSSTDGEVTYGLKAKMADGTEIPINSNNLTLETVGGSTLLPNDIPFGSRGLPSGATTRLWWNAPADLGMVQLPSNVISGITLQLVPTLAEGAPAGAQPAPATVASDGFTVDLRTVRTVTPGEKIPVVWEWWRTDKRDETQDYTEIYVKPQGDNTDEIKVLSPKTNNGEDTIEVTEDMWPSFRFVKYEKNPDASSSWEFPITGEILFQLPVATPQNVQATKGNPYTVTVTWDAVPYATGYVLDVTTFSEGSTITYTKYVFDGTRYVDTSVPKPGFVRYIVRARYPNYTTGEPSDTVIGWCSIDKAELKNLSTRWPWNGTVDIDIDYHTVRNQYAKATGTADNLPGKTVTIAVTTADGAAFRVESLIRERLEGDMIRRETVKNGEFTLGANDRIIWDTPTDAPRMHEPGSTLKVTLSGDEYSGAMTFEKTFDLDTRTGVIELPFGAEDIQIPWSTRWAKPGATSLGLTDNWWKQIATLTDVTDYPDVEDIMRTEARLGEGTVTSWTPKKWGLNTLSLTLSPASGDNERTEYAAVFKLPDFAFSVKASNADGVTLGWNALNGAKSYEILRREAGSSREFTVVDTVMDATTWTDNSDSTVVGDFEFVVVPKSATGGTLPPLSPVLGTRGAPQAPRNVQATRGDTAGVTVTWDAVPYAASYEVTIEGWDVAINRTVRIDTTEEARFVDKSLPRPGLGRYSVKTIYPNGYTSVASDSVVGYAVLETMQMLGVSNRWPWNGKVDIDIEYKTVRPRFYELFGEANIPYPDSVTITAQTAGGKYLPVRTLVWEPVIDGNYTVRRVTVQNGEQPISANKRIIQGSGGFRLVWDADADTLGINAPGTVITVTAADEYAHTAVSGIVDLNTTKPVAIPLTEKDTIISLPWAARWANESSESLNMQDGTDVKTVKMKYIWVPGVSGTMTLKKDTSVIETQTGLEDKDGVFAWKPNDYGVILLVDSFINRATGAKSVYKSKFIRGRKTLVTVEYASDNGGDPYIDVKWTGKGDYTNLYQIIRREVYRDGTRSDWQNMAPVSLRDDSTGLYRDIGVGRGHTYEYAACPIYYDIEDSWENITYTETIDWSAPCKVPPVPTNVVATTGNADAVTLTWDPVPDAIRYIVDITAMNAQGATTMRQKHIFEGTRYVDIEALPLGIMRYTVQAALSDGTMSEKSQPVVGYRSIDKAELKSVSTRRPWNGTVDIDIDYQTVRNKYAQLTGGANLPDKTVTIAVTTAHGENFVVSSLVRETLDGDMIRRENVKNGSFTLGANDRIIWDAPTDARAMYEPNSVLKITLNGDEYSEEIKFEQTFDLDTRTGVIELQGGVESIPILWSTRWAKPGVADLGVNDNWWKVRTVLKDETDRDNPIELLNTESHLGEGSVSTWTPTKWGLNTLTLIFSPTAGDNEQTEYSTVFNVMPDFTFTATQNNPDSIILEWNEPKGMRIYSYSIRRRAAGTDDAFVEVATCTDTTRWADISTETVIGKFEYTIMPLTDGNKDAWTQFNPVVGCRALDIARSVTIAPATNGTITADKTMAKYGETVTLTITPAIGYALDQLHVMNGEKAVDVVASEGTYTFLMPANEVQVSATFRIIDYSVTIISTANGTVIADKQTAHYGDEVTLTVTPNIGYALVQLSVTCDGTAIDVASSGSTRTFQMPAGNVVVSATFAAIAYTTAIAPAQNGSVTADRENAHYGNVVTLTVTPDAGYELDELIVMNGTTKVETTKTPEGNYTFTMPANNVQVSVTFKAIIYDITLVPPVNGTVTADKETAHIGETITLTVTPATGYTLDEIHVMNGTMPLAVVPAEGGKYTFVMPAGSVVISTIFKEIDYTITTPASANGTLTANKQTAHYTDEVVLTVTPATGYKLDELMVKAGDKEVTTSKTVDGTYTFTMPANNVQVTATFKAIDYTVTTAPALNGSVTADKQIAHYADVVTLTITPATGYELDQLSVMYGKNKIDATKNAEGNYQFTMPADDVKVSVTFKAIDYTVTTAPAQNGSVTADKQTAHYGDMVTLTVTPATDYELDQLIVMDGETAITTTPTAEGIYTFQMPAGNVQVSSTFKVATYTVTIVPTATGIITADKATAHSGETVTLTVTPAVGYEFDQLRVMDGETAVDVVKTAEGTYTFTMPANNVVVSATFKAIDYSITLTLAGSGSVIANKAIAHYGETIAITVTPAKGYELDQLHVINGETEVEVEKTTEHNYTFSMPAGDIIISAIFTIIPTDLEDTPAVRTAEDNAPRKVFRDGIVYIIHNGNTYTLTGVEVK